MWYITIVALDGAQRLRLEDDEVDGVTEEVELGEKSNSEPNGQSDKKIFSGVPFPNESADSVGIGSPQRQGTTHCSRGRGSKRTIVNSRSLVQAVSQQQKGSHQAKKASSRKH